MKPTVHGQTIVTGRHALSTCCKWEADSFVRHTMLQFANSHGPIQSTELSWRAVRSIRRSRFGKKAALVLPGPERGIQAANGMKEL